MPPSKGLTRHTRLRMTEDERALLLTAIGVYDRKGVRLSQNDMIRHLIRRAGIVIAHTPDAAADLIRVHCTGCSSCSFEDERFECPDGLYLYRTYRRVLRAHAGTQDTNAL